MKVCIFTHTFPRFKNDPSAPFMEELANSLAESKHKVFVLTPFDKKIDIGIKRKYKLFTYRYIFPKFLHLLGYSRTLNNSKKLSLLTYFLSIFMYFFAFFALLKLVKKEKIDIVSAHWIIPNGFIAALVSLVTKTALTITIPGSDVYLGTKNLLFRKMVGFASKKADFIISDSRYYLEQLHDLGFFPKNSEIIRYGVNKKQFAIGNKNYKLMKKIGINNNEKIILLMGRMVSKKGFIYAIDAFPKIKEKFPDTKMILIGDGGLKNGLIEKTKKLKIEKCVNFVGTVAYNKLVDYINLADLFIMPSIRDSQGNIDSSPVAMMNAMICGCPIIGTKYALEGNIAEKGVSYLVREKNSEDIAMMVCKIFGKPEELMTREEIRKKGVENFSIENTAKKYISVFKKFVP
ncbi:MAG: glycosyltransferase [bacterium]